MLLEKLNEYADQLDLPPPMYTRARVRWLVDLDEKGNLLGFVPLGGADRADARGKEMLVPHIARSSGIRVKVLEDTAEYVLGIPREPKRVKRVQQAHGMFKELVHKCAEQTGEPSVRAVDAFLDRWDGATAELAQDFDPTMNVTFRVLETIPIDLPSVRDFWAKETQPSAAPEMQCIVCGQMRTVEERLPFKVKGLPGGQSSGTALISANKAAFESYGLNASLVAPTCRMCGERFANAANHLLRQDETHLRLGSLAYIFWTREQVDFSIGSLLSQPDPEQVRNLLESAWKGQSRVVADTNTFYATALSASGGRVVVRDWIESTVGEVKGNLARWFNMQRLVDTYGSEGSPVGLYPLAASLYRDANRDMVPNVPQRLLRSALRGESLPEWLLFQAVRRNRAEQAVTRPRMVLTKMMLVSQENQHIEEENPMEHLEQSTKDPAYLCGRLMAEIEAVQRAAIPGAKATVIGRYFGTASSAPASVFGNLLRGAQAHLDKLRKEKEGAYHGLQAQLEEIMSGLEKFPKTLTLKEQALFSLGYYHQRAADRAAASAHKKSKDN